MTFKWIEPVHVLTWMDYVWMGLPVGLVFSGGLWGLCVGSMAIGTNVFILQTIKNPVHRYGLSAFISFVAIALGMVFANAGEFLISMNPPSDAP